MNRCSNRYCLLTVLTFCCIAVLLIFCGNASAADEITTGRKLWNNIMLVVNFGILVFLFIKFARKPLVDFLKAVVKKTEEQMNSLKSRFEEVRSVKNEEESRLLDIEKRLKDIQGRIIALGKAEKEKAIEQGRIAAEKMIEDAKEYAGYRMAKAKKEFSDEMIDLAIDIVKEKLAENISEEEEKKITEQFIANLDSAKDHVN